MTTDEKDALVDRLTVLSEYFGKELSSAQITLYVNALDDLPFDAIMAATNHVVKASKWLPKVAELRELVEGDGAEQSEAAWLEIHGEIRRVGSWRQPELSPVTRETMLRMCGTWERACVMFGQSEGPELLGWAKRWKEAYGVTRTAVVQGHLIGRDEARQILGRIPLPKQLPAADERAVPAVPEGVQVAGDVHPQRRRV